MYQQIDNSVRTFPMAYILAKLLLQQMEMRLVNRELRRSTWQVVLKMQPFSTLREITQRRNIISDLDLFPEECNSTTSVLRTLKGSISWLILLPSLQDLSGLQPRMLSQAGRQLYTR